MADLRLTHDPEDGCCDCPFADMFGLTEWHCNPADRAGERRAPRDPAPDWCPLRSGSVTVSPPDGSEG